VNNEGAAPFFMALRAHFVLARAIGVWWRFVATTRPLHLILLLALHGYGSIMSDNNRYSFAGIRAPARDRREIDSRLGIDKESFPVNGHGNPKNLGAPYPISPRSKPLLYRETPTLNQTQQGAPGGAIECALQTRIDRRFLRRLPRCQDPLQKLLE